MTRVILVRHGEASAAWGDDPDPGLSDLGRRQAAAVADALGPLPPRAVLSSPLRRCVETAQPLARRWGTEPRIEPAVAEIPSPPGVGLAARSAWLQSLQDRRWGDAPAATRVWCADVVAAVTALADDAVVFTHFVAINVLLGAAVGDDRAFLARFANCSRTVLDVVDGRLHLVERGAEADSRIG